MAKMDSRFFNIFATDEEASLGIMTNKAITPKQLKDNAIGGGSGGGNSIIEPASVDRAGIISIANQEDIIAGTNETKAITPK